MAITRSLFKFPILLVFVLFGMICVHGESETFGTNLDPAKMGLKKEETLTHFRVYWHDVVKGPKITSVQVAEGPLTKQSVNAFGAVFVVDNPLSLGPELNSSKLVGRSQGIYAFAAKDEPALLMAMNIVFLEGKFNGSSITVMGRSDLLSEIREMPIMGGSGIFQYARGYVQLKTYWAEEGLAEKTGVPEGLVKDGLADDPPSQFGDAIVEYNIYVYYYC